MHNTQIAVLTVDKNEVTFMLFAWLRIEVSKRLIHYGGLMFCPCLSK
ncbi:Uncharacterised protein [Enterobacter hormaechei]|uniref:Uncharacterized protein n=1 Tax=Pseudocitrobacter vendiensis TaxID=2488306 RepID=A0ABN8TG38_9ENTR|nr:hypothetical protein CSC12_6172 [Klebsiella michiganensis]ERP00203.1 hypothetical protein L360_04655 [Enterobacter sp. MGH 14]EUM74684.1 hypothetical protein L353_08676 [Enterobacter sp. MGH 7]CAH6661486.1 hypothetical protein FBBNIHIM_20460 [Pseudocitrobacter vendiensis]CZV74758.1 Uncharacterised protein [Enterobacter hormaechei]SWS17646.1 Uncharacterised protein [Klebsiella pneumoniae]